MAHGPTVRRSPRRQESRPDDFTAHGTPDRLTPTGSRSPATCSPGSPDGPPERSRTDHNRKPGQKDNKPPPGNPITADRPRSDGHRLRDTLTERSPRRRHPPPVLASLTSRKRPDLPQRMKAGRATMERQTDTKHRHGITGQATPPGITETRSGIARNGSVWLLTF